jgi:positive regulator of sigma E activity
MKNCGKRVPLVAAENRDKLPLRPGQIVEIANSPLRLLIQSLITLLPLVLGFITGFFLTRHIFPAAGEGARAAGGVFLLFAGGAVTLLLRRHYPPKEITRIKRVMGETSPPGY